MKKFLTGIIALFFVALLAIGATGNNEAAVGGTILTIAYVGAIPMRKGDSKRAIFTDLQGKFGGKNVAPSYIRAEALLLNAVGQYSFSLFRLGNEAPTEEKLNRQDAFCITDAGIFLAREIVAVPGATKLYTYPHADFADEVGFIQNGHLEVLYNGDISIKVGETTYLPNLSLKDCRVRRNAADERLPGDGLIPLVPTYTLKGDENNEVTLNIPATAAAKFETNLAVYKSKVVLWLEGFKIVGAGGRAAQQ